MSPLKTTRWDSAQHLKTEEDMVGYLDACLAEAGDDSAYIAHALGVIARDRKSTRLNSSHIQKSRMPSSA